MLKSSAILHDRNYVKSLLNFNKKKGPLNHPHKKEVKIIENSKSQTQTIELRFEGFKGVFTDFLNDCFWKKETKNWLQYPKFKFKFFIFYFFILFLFFHIFHLIFFFKQYKNCENFILNFLIIFITTFNFKNLKRDKFIEKQLNYIKN